jgi:hypothetical protein
MSHEQGAGLADLGEAAGDFALIAIVVVIGQWHRRRGK